MSDALGRAMAMEAAKRVSTDISGGKRTIESIAQELQLDADKITLNIIEAYFLGAHERSSSFGRVRIYQKEDYGTTFPDYLFPNLDDVFFNEIDKTTTKTTTKREYDGIRTTTSTHIINNVERAKQQRVSNYFYNDADYTKEVNVELFLAYLNKTKDFDLEKFSKIKNLNDVARRKILFGINTHRMSTKQTSEIKFAQSNVVDASKIALEDLNGDTNDIILSALGRYFINNVKDFTKEGKMELLQKYIDIAEPEKNDFSKAFPMSVSDSGQEIHISYTYFLLQLPIKDEELKQILDKHPCISSCLFFKHPKAYNDEAISKVIENEMKHPMRKNIIELEHIYTEYFGEGFDEIIINTEDGKSSVGEAVCKYMNRSIKVCSIGELQEIPQKYIIKNLPQLLDRFSYESLKSQLVTEENKETLGKLLAQTYKDSLSEKQNIVDCFFEEQGNPNYAVMSLPTTLGGTIDLRAIERRSPNLYKVLEPERLIYSTNNIGSKKYPKFLLINLKRIKEIPHKQLTLYVPAEMIGKVIGKGGSNIKKIEELTGKSFFVKAGDFRATSQNNHSNNEQKKKDVVLSSSYPSNFTDKKSIDNKENKNMKNKNLHFFLGGNDLEMKTIKDLLDKQGVAYSDSNLGWGATTSKYGEEIEKVAKEGKTPVIIELGIDSKLPENTINIDHHNENASKPASILQVCDLLGIEPTRKMQLIAANDSGYIPAMLEMGATKEEIAQIRYQDRAAQGITPEQENKQKNQLLMQQSFVV